MNTMSISTCNNEMMSEVAKCFASLEHLKKKKKKKEGGLFSGAKLNTKKNKSTKH